MERHATAHPGPAPRRRPRTRSARPAGALSHDPHLYCPVRATMDLLGQKWTLHIVRELVAGRRRFNQLAHALGGVNARTLSKRLHLLETRGLISRSVRSAIPPWVEYDLTEKGRTLYEVIDAIARWGRRWMAQPAAASAPSGASAGRRPGR
jgi:DNA-binding HxlR family transcriptional regulator